MGVACRIPPSNLNMNIERWAATTHRPLIDGVRKFRKPPPRKDEMGQALPASCAAPRDHARRGRLMSRVWR